ncbi:hypothetical protein SOV_49220 [Sporomusa ovata DSM 2662]|uniref:Uncharacterized protein n=1 Tax=Sporomusa ovata TaxID=2378 RepID=A0A0U1L0E1_9FIRM|nr:hypothetical protein [Sporomusa ovata]EQB27296.1 hypothetical protein SOV_2c01910 [Sporomusa ovata DSM 2662]CQR73138.1 hypothetical protein SpAn4DRAFT_2370 [Sporomusa ovata]
MKSADKIEFDMTEKEFQKLLDELPKLLQELEKERDIENSESLAS